MILRVSKNSLFKWIKNLEYSPENQWRFTINGWQGKLMHSTPVFHVYHLLGKNGVIFEKIISIDIQRTYCEEIVEIKRILEQTIEEYKKHHSQQ